MSQWKSYRSAKPTSGVTRYKIGENHDYIDIEFAHIADQVYRYKRNVIGDAVDEMIDLAEKGDGLSSYINEHPEVRYGFTIIERKEAA